MALFHAVSKLFRPSSLSPTSEVFSIEGKATAHSLKLIKYACIDPYHFVEDTSDSLVLIL